MQVVYLDYQATTPVDKRVMRAMEPYFCEKFGNPHAIQHPYGRKSAEAVEEARARVASLIGGKGLDIVFTSGATEANNLALRGLMHAAARRGKNHLVTSAFEHKSVLATCEALEKEGFSITHVPVTPQGFVEPQRVAEAITPQTALVSIMAVNNEIGTIQPLAEIGEICKKAGVPFHSDAVQAAGKIPFDVEEMNLDMVSLSAHKTYGPKGIGALYLRRESRVTLDPIITGGSQERGLRAGTVATPLCVGFGVACDIAARERDEEAPRLTALRNELLDRLQTGLGKRLSINGSLENRLYENLNVSISGVEAAQLMSAWSNKLAVSYGSACSAGSTTLSHVLQAIGRTGKVKNAIRFSLGRQTTRAEIERTAEIVLATCADLGLAASA